MVFEYVKVDNQRKAIESTQYKPPSRWTPATLPDDFDLEVLPVPAFITRLDDGLIWQTNGLFDSIFQLNTRPMGQSLPEFYDPEGKRAISVCTLMAQVSQAECEVCARVGDRPSIGMTLSLKRLQFRGETAILGAIHPDGRSENNETYLRDLLRDRQRLQTEVEARSHQQAAMTRLGQLALKGMEVSVLMDEAAFLLARTLEVEYTHVLELQPNGHAFFLRSGIGWKPGLVGQANVSASPASQAGYTLHHNQPVVVEDLRVETRFSGQPWLHNHRIVAGMTVPIEGRQSAFGVLGAHTRYQRQFREDEVRFLEAIANLLGTAIARKQSEERLHLMERAIASSSNGIAIADASQSDHPVIYVNPSFEQMTGYSAEEVIGRSADFWQEGESDPTSLAELHQALQEGREYHIILRNARKDGTLFWNELYISPVRNARGHLTHFIGIQNDITERKYAEEQLLHSAYYDSLTNLPNRDLFLDRLWHTIRRAKRRGNYIFAVLFLDLDRFKTINDSLGHTIGDRLLVEIARRLESCLRPSDTLARLGGDEFTILLEEIQTTEDASKIADRIHVALRAPFTLNGREVFTNASIGIALSSTGYKRPEDLLRDADTAMYRAKALGKARHITFDTDMHDNAVARLQLETDLRLALQRQEFLLHYQPIVLLCESPEHPDNCCCSSRIVGFEALVRWQHPTRGLVSPGEFIPMAEETGAIVPIGLWVLHQACRQLRQWQQQFPDRDDLCASVNLSCKQFSQTHLIEQIDAILEETGLDGHYLKLEITESTIVENAQSAASMLAQLKQRRIQICIDDFGTGYSSLSYLHRFPSDTLKIDRSFVGQMGNDGEKAEIVRAILTLAHELGMDAIAEGVETYQQLQQLRSLHCEYGQGYYFAKPLDVAAATEAIASSPHW